MKNRGLIIFLIILLSLICIALITLMCFLLMGKSNFWFIKSVSTDLVVDEVYEMNFSKIDVEADLCDVEIKETSDDKIKVKIYGKKEDISLNISGNELTIDIKGEKKFGFRKEISKVEIYLPESFENTLSIKSEYGDIKIGKLLNSNIDIEAGCGDVSVIAARDIKINNEYGDIELKEAKIANINADAGDIKVGNIDNITVVNHYGDIDIDNIFNFLDATDNCGDIEIKNLDIKENSKIYNDFGDIDIGSTNEIYIDAKTDLGDVEVNNNYQKSDVTLKIDNNCGDIKVKN